MYVILHICLKLHGDHRDLLVLTLSFPTPRSSDLPHASLRCDRRQDASDAQEVRHQGRDLCADRSRLQQTSEEHTSELQELMRISYAVFCFKKQNISNTYIFILEPYTELIKLINHKKY